MDRGFVITNERLATNIPGVYAVGDIVPGLQLAHRGFQQGIFVAEEIAGLNPVVISDSNIPKVTYSDPEVASVGLSESAAQEQYGADSVTSYDYNLGGNGKSSIIGTSGSIKVVRVNDGPVVGVHMIGARVGELIGEDGDGEKEQCEGARDHAARMIDPADDGKRLAPSAAQEEHGAGEGE